MRTSFKSLGVIAALLSSIYAQAQQVLEVEQIEQALQEPQLIQSDEVLEQDTLVLESDAQVQQEKPKKKRKGATVPVKAHLFEGENTFHNMLRTEKAQRDLALHKLIEEAKLSAPKVEAEKGIFDKLKDAVMGASSASFNQKSFALGQSESTAESDFFDQVLTPFNAINQLYIIGMYFGEQRVHAHMQVDTNWDSIVIKTAECVLYDWDDEKATLTTCPGNLYDTETSDNYDDQDESVPFESRFEAGKLYVSGFQVKDDLCLINDEDLCIEDVTMLDIREQTGMPALIEGVFGLPTGVVYPPNLPPYMKYLFDEQVLTEQIFAIAVKGLGEDTFMDIGEIFEENMSDEDDIVYFTTTTPRWTATVSGLQFGENDARQFTLTPANAIFDTASSYVRVPESEWEFVINQLVRELEYEQYSIDTETFTATVDCNANLFYDMYFFLDGLWWAEMRAEDFILDQSPTQNGESCVIAIKNSTTSVWILGLPFLRGFYVVFDQPNARTGLVPYIGSAKKELEEGTQPTETLDLDEASNWATYGVIAAVVVVFGAYIGSVYIGG